MGALREAETENIRPLIRGLRPVQLTSLSNPHHLYMTPASRLELFRMPLGTFPNVI